MLKKLCHEVKKGEPLYCVHAEFKNDFSFAQRLTNGHGSGYTIGRAEQLAKSYVEF